MSFKTKIYIFSSNLICYWEPHKVLKPNGGYGGWMFIKERATVTRRSNFLGEFISDDEDDDGIC